MKQFKISILLSLLLFSCQTQQQNFNLLEKPMYMESKLKRIDSNDDTIIKIVIRDACNDIYIYDYNSGFYQNEDNTFFRYLHYRYKVGDTIQ